MFASDYTFSTQLLQSRGTQVLQGLKDDQENRYNGDGDFIKPLPCHRLQNMHKYP